VVVVVVRVRGIGLALSRAAPGTLHPDTDRPIFAGRSGCTRPVPCRGPEKSSCAYRAWCTDFVNFFSSSTPDSGRSVCARSHLSPPPRGCPFGATDQPAKEPVPHRLCYAGHPLVRSAHH
jgi:hypothetical protein